jgi:ribonucleoside-triphosphate reductase
VKRFPAIITASEKGNTPYYTNSSHLPVGYTEDIFEALDIQDELQTLYTSGTVFHAFLGEKLPDWKSAANLVRKIAENHRLPYYSISPTYSVCKTHGYIAGEHFTCPECGETAEVYSRITGYYRPVQNWNDGKSQEYKDRVVYDVLNKTDIKAEAAKKEEACDCCASIDETILFATKTCPNCRIAASLLDKANINYRKVYVEDEPELAKQLGLKQAPTLVVGNEKIVNVSNIKKYLGN